RSQIESSYIFLKCYEKTNGKSGSFNNRCHNARKKKAEKEINTGQTIKTTGFLCNGGIRQLQRRDLTTKFMLPAESD
ncbi:hypothetical protein, partial [Rheinheimera sp.]|uniref:hypothetical protein n=1 Tax=Rheinheimera sp. TaxID=1869214 RepID=UPI0027BB06FB